MKLKSIKVSEDTYKDIIKLQKMLEKNKVLEGLNKVKITNAINYAVKSSLSSAERKKMMMKAAGSWSDIDCDKLIKEIYKSRKSKGTRPEVKLWDIF